MFGKSVPLLAIVLVCMLTIGASAILVDYLSTSVETDVAVTSPFKVGISTGEEHPSWANETRWRPRHWHGGEWVDGAMIDAFPEGWDGDPNTTGVYVGLDSGGWTWSDWATTEPVEIVGGQTITLYLMSQNLADAQIIAHEEFRIYNSDGISSDDFVSMSVRYDAIYGDSGYGTLYADGTDWYSGPSPWSNSTGIEVLVPENTSEWGGDEADVSQWQIKFNAAASGTYTFSYRITPRADLEP